MRLLVRHLLSMAILPGSAAILVPYLIDGRAHPARWTTGAAAITLTLAGVLLLGAGAFLFAWSLQHFWVHGRGTLAPWDPPRAFVASGPYRVVRNPMISGVFLVLLAEACLLQSVPIGLWAATFIAINAAYIPLSEEPALRRRFGAPYAQYLQAVPRFLPRWHHGDANSKVRRRARD
jgi:protein-S-isoprenylcysteine O-methyltransferase Ste14